MPRRMSIQHARSAESQQKISAARPAEAQQRRSIQLTHCCHSNGRKLIDLQLGSEDEVEPNVQHPHSGLSQEVTTATRIRDIAAIIAAIALRRTTCEPPHLLTKES